MRRFLGGMLVVLLCGATGGEAGEEKLEARLVEAQAALDEAMKLRDAGGYCIARPLNGPSMRSRAGRPCSEVRIQTSSAP